MEPLGCVFLEQSESPFARHTSAILSVLIQESMADCSRTIVERRRRDPPVFAVQTRCLASSKPPAAQRRYMRISIHNGPSYTYRSVQENRGLGRRNSQSRGQPPRSADNDALQTLRVCFLTCRAWTPRTRPHLFCTVRIRCCPVGEKNAQQFVSLASLYSALSDFVTTVVARSSG